MSPGFPAFALSDEHRALRESVRALAEDKIVPRAAEADRTAEFPWDVYDALVRADLEGWRERPGRTPARSRADQSPRNLS